MAEKRVRRRLAAILAAHVVGYSRLMGVDIEGTLATLNAHRIDLIEPCIAGHRGAGVQAHKINMRNEQTVIQIPSNY